MSAFSATESYPCINGYISSCIERGKLFSYLFLKSSLSNIRATVYLLVNSIISLKFILDSHSELYAILVFSLSNILVTCFKYVSPDNLVCSNVNACLVLLLPDGSPIIPVKSPITKTTSCPISWNVFKALKTTVWPKCRSGLEGSAPSFIVSFFPLSNFLFSSSSENISTAFLLIKSILFIYLTLLFFKLYNFYKLQKTHLP